MKEAKKNLIGDKTYITMKNIHFDFTFKKGQSNFKKFYKVFEHLKFGLKVQKKYL